MFGAMETLDVAYADARPKVGKTDAERLASVYWNRNTTARELPSERDRVFELTATSGELTFLKVSNALEPLPVLETQNTMLKTLADAQTCYRFPKLLPSTDQTQIIETELADRRHFVHLLEEVPGISVGNGYQQSPELLRQIGRMLAIVDRNLSESQTDDRTMIWDLRGARTLIEKNLHHVTDDDRRQLLQRCLARYDEHVVPLLPELRESLIYNDANPENLRIDPSGRGTPKVIGLVDFGDSLRSWTVAELAVACAYAGLDKRSPISAFCDLARGYVLEYVLTEAEADVVFELARIRLALSVTVSAVRASQDPSNDYLRISEGSAWNLLEQLSDESEELAHYRLREACGYPPCAHTERVVAILKKASKEAGAILDPDPRNAPTVTIDLSVESGEDASMFDPNDSTEFSRHVTGLIKSHEAAIGIGRFDEVRTCYRSEPFCSPTDGADEWRTVHLGIDLFAPAGTPVSSPLPGRVCSVLDNAGRLDYGPTIIVEHEIDDESGPVRFWTLYGHLTFDTLEKTQVDQRIQAGEVIGAIGSPPQNGDWAPHLHFQVLLDRLGYEGTFPGVALPSQRETWIAISPNPNHLLGIPAKTTAERSRQTSALLEDRERTLGPSLSLSYAKPLHIVRGRGTVLFDIDAQPYLDCVNNVAHVGHSHPRVMQTAAKQMGTLNTNTRYLHENILRYSARLTSLFPKPLEVCFLVCSGTEANELALRMARTHTGKVGAVVLDGAYHGNSSSVINLSPYKFNGPGGKGLRPWVRVAAMPDCYRGQHRGEEKEVAPLYAAEVRQAVEALESEPTWFGDQPPGAAAFFHESLLSCGGQIPLPEGYLRKAYEGARAQGAVCVADEVQVGFGRVGSDWWAFEEQGVVPDIVTLGKPIGNGHPLGAVITTREIADSFDNGMEYFNTFAGNPVSCAIGQTVLDVIEEEGLRENAARIGTRLLDDLATLGARYPWVGDVRGRGLFLGIEFVRVADEIEPDASLADSIVQKMRDRGILLSTDGPDHNVIKFKPPLTFSESDGDLLISNLSEVFAETPF